jgi:hypothetical protein
MTPLLEYAPSSSAAARFVVNKVKENQNYFSLIVGEQLSAVSFVMDYLQLQFNACILTVLTPLTVVVDQDYLHPGEVHYRNALCERITHKVEEVALTSEYLRIDFDDGAVFKISLKEEDYVGAEAINFQFPEDGRMQFLVL